MSNLIEVATYTAGTQEYADQVLDQIDPSNTIQYRFYRQDCILNKKEQTLLKDLTFVQQQVEKQRKVNSRQKKVE